MKSELSNTADETAELNTLSHHWGWMLILGSLFVILGIWAFAMPIASTLGLNFGIASILVISGLLQLTQAIRLRHGKGSTARFVHAVLALLIGALMFRYPSEGILGIALSLSLYFFIGGASQWMVASALRPITGSAWGYVSAAASFLLGLLIVITFPFSALWIPGTLLGVELVFFGGSLIGLSFLCRKYHKGADREHFGMKRPRYSNT